ALSVHRRAERAPVLEADHRAHGVRVAADEIRHDRGIGDEQALDALHAQLRAHHRARIGPHTTGADRVVGDFGVGANVLLERWLGRAVLSRQDLLRNPIAQGWRAHDPTNDLHTSREGIYICRRLEEATVDERRLRRDAGGEPERTAAAW